MIKIILDTNVLITGVQDESSYAFRIIDACRKKKIQAIFNRPLLKENRLKSRELIKEREYLKILEDFYRKAKNVPHKSRVQVVKWDKEDNKLVEAAIDGKAGYIVTEDNDLLFLGEYNKIKMVTPQEFWRHYQAENDDNEEWDDWMKGIINGF
ncbi:putative toxin-antitoxin system toxin component, PIN family [Patescibacteria group bacterium]|nr:putative toxin-antitoxin system toxin component, PIN family [Patescibacteria group bacterium]